MNCSSSAGFPGGYTDRRNGAREVYPVPSGVPQSGTLPPAAIPKPGEGSRVRLYRFFGLIDKWGYVGIIGLSSEGMGVTVPQKGNCFLGADSIYNCGEKEKR